ncbi:hypothetical protein ABZZ80_30435 [Streptomyces sp. NPDC006356]
MDGESWDSVPTARDFDGHGVTDLAVAGHSADSGVTILWRCHCVQSAAAGHQHAERSSVACVRTS